MTNVLKRRYDAVLFDLDGTLLETAPEIAAAVNDALADIGLPPVEPALIRRFIGHGVRQTLSRSYDQAQVSRPNPMPAEREAAIDRAMARFDHHYGQRHARLSAPFPGTLEALRALQGAGIRRALVTNKETRFVDQVLAGSELGSLLEVLVCGDTLAHRKPSPAPALHALAQLGVPRERALLVGDSAIDVACARNAGIEVWLVPFGYNGGVPAAESRPDRVIANLGEVALACAPVGDGLATG